LTELLEILGGLESEICGTLGECDHAITNNIKAHFLRCKEIVVSEMERQASPEIQLAIASGKVEAYENALNALMRQK